MIPITTPYTSPLDSCCSRPRSQHEMTVRPLEEMSLSGSSDSDDALRRKIIDLDPQTTRRVPSGVKVAGTEKVKSKTNLLQEKKRRPTENLSVQMVRC